MADQTPTLADAMTTALRALAPEEGGLTLEQLVDACLAAGCTFVGATTQTARVTFARRVVDRLLDDGRLVAVRVHDVLTHVLPDNVPSPAPRTGRRSPARSRPTARHTTTRAAASRGTASRSSTRPRPLGAGPDDTEEQDARTRAINERVHATVLTLLVLGITVWCALAL